MGTRLPTGKDPLEAVVEVVIAAEGGGPAPDCEVLLLEGAGESG